MAVFKFKQFDIRQDKSAMKVNTDGILLGAWVDVESKRKALDIGCGNGLISMMMAQRNPDLEVVGVELDEGSCEDAFENFRNSPFSTRLEVVKQSIQDYTRTCQEEFDLIVSNPPFFTGGTFSMNENKANVRHTIKLPHGDLLTSVNRVLSEVGEFVCILPEMEGIRFIELADRARLNLNHKCIVHSRTNLPPERLILSFTRNRPDEIQESKIFIHEGDSNVYSKQYYDLTCEFYL